MDVLKPPCEAGRDEDASERHQLTTITIHSRVLMHRVHLRDAGPTEIVGDQQIIDRKASTENISTDDESILSSEIQSVALRVDHENPAVREVTRDVAQQLLQRRRWYGLAELFV